MSLGPGLNDAAVVLEAQAAGLEALATGQAFDLTAEGRARAATLAARVRREMPTSGAMTPGI
jgi:hypothetical protein